MSYELVTIERNNHIATVSLNRPEKLNALSLDLMEELVQVADEFQEDTDTRVVIFTGAGKHFSAGADLNDPRRASLMNQPFVARRRTTHIGQRLIRRLQEIEQITIAAINGGALGGAACIVTALDFRIGSDDSFVSYPEINLGMNLSWLGLPLCAHLVGPARAKRLIILGEKEQANTLLQWGFLDKVVPRAELLKAANDMAADYAAKPPVAAQMIKRSINVVSSALDHAIMHMDTDQFLLTTSTEDFQEASLAYFEKRTPVFRGR